MAINSVIGTGEATKQAIASSLKDIMNEGDELTVIWDSPTSDTLDALLDVVREVEYEFNMLYVEGENPPKIFRQSSHGVCTKVRNKINSALDAVSKDGAVLFLWDDDENDGEETLIDHVFDRLGDNATVLDLGQGLTPITCNPPVDIPEQVEIDDEEEEEEAVEDFTRDELASMPAAAVKAWGLKKGLKSTTKSAIVREAFPEDEEDEEEEVEDVPSPPLPDREEAGNVGSAKGDDTDVQKALRQAASWLIKAANLLDS